jgi:hypothetical protein
LFQVRSFIISSSFLQLFLLQDKRAHIRSLVRGGVLPVRLLAEANALPGPGLAPFPHAWQEQKESISLSSFRMPSNPG